MEMDFGNCDLMLNIMSSEIPQMTSFRIRTYNYVLQITSISIEIKLRPVKLMLSQSQSFKFYYIVIRKQDESTLKSNSQKPLVLPWGLLYIGSFAWDERAMTNITCFSILDSHHQTSLCICCLPRVTMRPEHCKHFSYALEILQLIVMMIEC